MRGAATQAMPVCIVEERQQSRCPPAAAPLGASSKMYTLFPDGPLVLLVCVSFSGPAFSRIYNCKDKDGNIIISTTSPHRSRERGRDPRQLAADSTNPRTQDSGFR